MNQLQTQKLQHKILPQQIALLNLFHLDSLALEQKIQDEINDNPLLEEINSLEQSDTDKFSKDTIQDFQGYDEYGYDDIPDYKIEYQNYLPEGKIPDRPVVETEDFRIDLKRQYRFIESSLEKQSLADFLIDSLDEHGFLNQDLESVSEEISFKNNIWVETDRLEEVLSKIQQLDPLGVGSRDIKEFYLIQLKHIPKNPCTNNTIYLLENHFNDLKSRNLIKVRREMKLDESGFQQVLQYISTLKTRPVTETSNNFLANNKVMPEFIIHAHGDSIEAVLANQRSNNLRISSNWIETVQHAEQDTTMEKSAKQYLRSKLTSAQWFINAIKERESNMLKVMRAMVNYQKIYFLSGDSMNLKPMVLKNIADIVKLDISTVSRITCNKYADTPFGMILLKNLFTEGLVNKAGESISNKVIRMVVEDTVKTEDRKNPYTDQQLAEILMKKGYSIARRTVAKYRDILHIPVAQMRAFRI